jgi:hypothetical protein
MGCCGSSSFVQSCSRPKTRFARLKNGLGMTLIPRETAFNVDHFYHGDPGLPTFSSPADTDFWFVPICTIRIQIAVTTLSRMNYL